MNAVNKAGQFTIDEQRTIFKIKIILHMYVLYNVTYIYLTWTKWNNSEKNQSLPIKHRKMRKSPRLFHKNLYLRGKERIWNLEYECAFSAWCSCLLIAGRLADWPPRGPGDIQRGGGGVLGERDYFFFKFRIKLLLNSALSRKNIGIV